MITLIKHKKKKNGDDVVTNLITKWTQFGIVCKFFSCDNLEYAFLEKKLQRWGLHKGKSYFNIYKTKI